MQLVLFVFGSQWSKSLSQTNLHLFYFGKRSPKWTNPVHTALNATKLSKQARGPERKEEGGVQKEREVSREKGVGPRKEGGVQEKGVGPRIKRSRKREGSRGGKGVSGKGGVQEGCSARGLSKDVQCEAPERSFAPPFVRLYW